MKITSKEAGECDPQPGEIVESHNDDRDDEISG